MRGTTISLVLVAISGHLRDRSCPPAGKSRSGKDANAYASYSGRRLRARLRARPECALQRPGGCVMSLSGPPSAVDLLAAVGTLADADANRAGLPLPHDRADAGRAPAGRADDHHIRDLNRPGLLDHAPGLDLRGTHPARVAHRARPRVALDHVQVLDEHAALLRARLEDTALLAAVLAAQHLDEIAFLDLHRLGHQRTSGARETIFMKFFSRSSRATGPKMRVPRGLLAASMITAAFSSNAIEVPSSRPYGFFVRTTTARTKSPSRTAPCGVAVFTVPTITSPTRA